MAFKPAICTQCGGTIEVDDSKEAGICKFCGTAFITEKVINHYITQNNYAGATLNIQNGVDIENLYTLARRALAIGDDSEAAHYYGQIRERNPNDWEAVFYYSLTTDSSVISNTALALDLIFSSDDSLEEKFEKVNKIQDFFPPKELDWNSTDDNDELINIIRTKVRDYIFLCIHQNNEIINLPLAKIYKAYIIDYLYPGSRKFIIDSFKSIYNLQYDPEHLEEIKILMDECFKIAIKCSCFKHNLTTDLIDGATHDVNKSELKLFKYKSYLYFWQRNLTNKEYKEVVLLIKELDPNYEPEKRTDSPEIRRKKRRVERIKTFFKKLILHLFFGSIPIALIRIPFDGISYFFEDHPFISVLGCIIYYFAYFVIVVVTS